MSAQPDPIAQVLAYLADRIEGAPNPERRAQLAGLPPDTALDVAAAVLVGIVGRSEDFVAGVLRGLLEARDLEAWLELEAGPS